MNKLHQSQGAGPEVLHFRIVKESNCLIASSPHLSKG